MKICITGGSGFIGGRLCSELSAAGHMISVLTRTPPTNTKQVNVRYIRADLTVDSDAIDVFLSNCDVLFHCAGVISNKEEMRPVHIEGTRRLIKAARNLRSSTGKKIHWVQLSSTGAYGPDQRDDRSSPRIVLESTRPSPVGEYEITKTESDLLVIAAAESDDISCAIVRPSNVFGKDMSNQSLRAMASMIRKGLFFYIGKKDAISAYVHVDDVVDCLIACGFNDAAKGHVFNVSNDCPQEDFVKAIATHAGVAEPRIRLPEWLVRSLVRTIGKFVPLPLNENRINALRTKTTYPTTKIETVLGVKPKRDVRLYIAEIVQKT